MTTLRLPTEGGGFETFTPRDPVNRPRPAAPAVARRAYAAAHVVADPRADNTSGTPAVLDWDSTLAFRRHLWSWGLGVAEAMDTAQRGMGLNWGATQELIRRSSAEARSVGGAIACGAGTDQLPPDVTGLERVRDAYLEQLEVVEGAGATPILMASRHLAATTTDPQDYASLYDAVLSQTSTPVILHWLGPMFDPQLTGYWGSTDPAEASDTVLDLIRRQHARIDGIKVSLLDADHERALRARLPEGVRLYTGDDFNYPELIKGESGHHSDALLGIFAAIAPAASAALAALDTGDLGAFDAQLDPTVALARHLFAAPTYYYKTGIAFLAWLNGHQPGFVMVGGLQAGRSALHLVEAFRLADAAGVLERPDLAMERMATFLHGQGLA